MSQIYVRKSDGVRFVSRATRETFSNESPAEVKRSLLDMSEITGNKAVVVKGDDHELHVVSGDDDGFSLGECVLAALREKGVDSENIIWCEEVDSEKGDALLVIVLNGYVQYDSVIPPAQLDRDALTLLVNSETEFDIVVHGNVPLSKPDDDELVVADSVKLSLQKEIVADFRVMESALFPEVLADDRYQYELIGRAFKKAGLANNRLKQFSLAAIIIFGLYMSFSVDKEENSSVNTRPVDLYSEYKKEVSSSHPGHDFVNVLMWIDKLRGIEGISLVSADLNDRNLTVTAKLNDSVARKVVEGLEDDRWKISIGSGDIVLRRKIESSSREVPTTIPSFQSVVSVFVDNSINVGFKPVIGGASSNGSLKKAKLSISYKSETHLKNRYVALMLEGHPIVLQKMSVVMQSKDFDEYTLSLIAYGNG